MGSITNMENEIIIDRGQFDDIYMLCGYCNSVREKEIVCKGGKHEMSHFGFVYRFYCWSGLSRFIIRYWTFGLKQVMYRWKIIKPSYEKTHSTNN